MRVVRKRWKESEMLNENEKNFEMQLHNDWLANLRENVTEATGNDFKSRNEKFFLSLVIWFWNSLELIVFRINLIETHLERAADKTEITSCGRANYIVDQE